MHAAMVIDRRSPAPLQRQIYDGWRQAILTGQWHPGDRIPSTRELAEDLGVSRTTVVAAYDQLMGEGYLESTRGRGMFVCHQLPDAMSSVRTVPREDAATSTAARLSRYGRRLDAKVSRSPGESGVINLSKLSPAIDRFPLQRWRGVLNRHLRTVTSALFDYSEQVAGYEPLRTEIAAYLARSRAVQCTADQVIVVNSSQQALDLCARVLVNPGDEVALENPGYDRARELFAAHGAKLRPVRVTSDGLSMDDLGRSTSVVHVTPSHQFPMGVSLSLARRIELIDWATSTNAVLLEDDYDSEFRYHGPPLPAMQSLAGRASVIYIGTFSKVMFPGLRIGYLVVPRALVTPFARAKRLSDRHTVMLSQAALVDFMHEGHLDRHIRHMRRLYRIRREVTIEALTRHFGEDVSVQGEAAGLHLVVRFRAGRIGTRATRRGVELMSTASYYFSAAPRDEFIIGFSAIDERHIREGVKRLAS
jgi:GntR family transcriptional regulator/MocR family aminotransferase